MLGEREAKRLRILILRRNINNRCKHTPDNFCLLVLPGPLVVSNAMSSGIQHSEIASPPPPTSSSFLILVFLYSLSLLLFIFSLNGLLYSHEQKVLSVIYFYYLTFLYFIVFKQLNKIIKNKKVKNKLNIKYILI